MPLLAWKGPPSRCLKLSLGTELFLGSAGGPHRRSERRPEPANYTSDQVVSDFCH